jgi:hypothetical protein
MKVKVAAADALKGRPIYVVADHAFDFEAPIDSQALVIIGDAGTTSLALDTLQVEVSIRTRRCLWLWGYSPRKRWVVGRIPEPTANEGAVEVVGAQLTRGASLRVSPDGEVREVFDRSTGWFGVFAATTSVGQGVRVSTDTILLVTDAALIAVLVRPANWRELVAG